MELQKKGTVIDQQNRNVFSHKFQFVTHFLKGYQYIKGLEVRYSNN